MSAHTHAERRRLRLTPLSTFLIAGALCSAAVAKQDIRDAFFTAYPDAIGTVIETVPSQTNHCGVCHYRFTGGGTRNPFGLLVENTLPNFPNTADGMVQAILSIGDQDPDGDGYSTNVEVTDLLNFSNTPTFPGLTPANVGQVDRVDITEIQDFLVPSAGADTTPPDVTVTYPTNGVVLIANSPVTVTWNATDDTGVISIDLFASYDGGTTYKPVAFGLTNSGSYGWFPPNRPTTMAFFRVVALDAAGNVGSDISTAYTIESPPGGLVPTTLRDFDLPGTEPLEVAAIESPDNCATCHGGYDQAVEPQFNWQGGMMAQASVDPLFKASLAVANQDAPESGDLCLRCHIPTGWLGGRSSPTDGQLMLATDKVGVSCDFCHRLIDPIESPENPAEDAAVLASLGQIPPVFSTGMFVVDPVPNRRGPFADATSGHDILVSPFHQEAALCGTCHDVSNPAFTKDANGNYPPNTLDSPPSQFASHALGPVERTYSEWFFSAYNSPQGVYAPQFGGNKEYVASCQDCHMRDVTGQGCNMNPPVRTDLPLHDLTGGNAWMPEVLATLYPDQSAELLAAADRARYMLQNAATLTAQQMNNKLAVRVVNESGHKLPTGYPEGRRAWLNVSFFSADGTLLAESGAYDEATGVLTHDAALRIYEVKPGIDADVAGLTGLATGPSFHFVLNNKIYKDTRIPPRGFSQAAYEPFGGAPIGATYADGQYWDDVEYTIPAGAVTAEVYLRYQTTSKEMVEFLRDENVTDNTGQELYDLWLANGKCPPETMAAVTVDLITPRPGQPTVIRTPNKVQSINEVNLPPDAPSGLVGSALTGAIDLAWSPATADDLAGYMVYRAEAPGGMFSALTANPIVETTYLDSSVMAGVSYLYFVTSVDTGGRESQPSGTVEVTATASSMHVASILLSVDDQGGGNKYGVATVTIVNGGGNPVANASVTGTFSGDFNGTIVADTDAGGVAVLTIGPKGGRTNFSFCVDDVTHGTFDYVPGDNVVTCASN